jgi:hypothetical protein
VPKGAVAALVVLPPAAAVGTLLVGLRPVLAVQVILVAWLLGRAHEAKAQTRREMLEQVGRFAQWAEERLAEAPEELPPEQEQLRRQLQRDYQEAQALLRRLDG